MLAPENIKVMSNGKYRRWAASIGGGNIGYVVFVLSLIVLAVTLAVLGGSTRGRITVACSLPAPWCFGRFRSSSLSSMPHSLSRLSSEAGRQRSH